MAQCNYSSVVILVGKINWKLQKLYAAVRLKDKIHSINKPAVVSELQCLRLLFKNTTSHNSAPTNNLLHRRETKEGLLLQQNAACMMNKLTYVRYVHTSGTGSHRCSDRWLTGTTFFHVYCPWFNINVLAHILRCLLENKGICITYY